MLELVPNPLLAGILAVVGLVLGVLLTSYAASRSVAQPLALAVEDEVRLLLGVLTDLRRLPYLTSLTPEDFAAGSHSRIWSAMLRVAEPQLARLPADPSDDECADVGRVLVEHADEFHHQLQQLLASSPTGVPDLQRLAYLSGLSATQVLTDDDVVEAGQAVLLTGTDRNKLSGAGLVVPSSTPDSYDPQSPPLRRVRAVVSRTRRVVTGLVAAAAGAVLPGLVNTTGLTGASYWVALASLVGLLAGSVVISLVDIDTMYIDLRSFLVTTAGVWGGAVVAVGLAGQWGRLVSGVVVVAAVAVVFEVANRVYRWRRGVDGQGFGDTLIVIVTVGIPSALVGDWTLGYYSGMAAMVGALIGWVAGFASGKLTRTSPMAFGPYLAAGWVLGWAASVLIR